MLPVQQIHCTPQDNMESFWMSPPEDRLPKNESNPLEAL